MTFGSRLTEARKLKGLTQDGLGKGLGTDGKDASKAVVYGWEKDQHFPRVDQLVLICERLGVTADYLLFGVTPVSELPADLADCVAQVTSLPPKHRQVAVAHIRQILDLLNETLQATDDSSSSNSDVATQQQNTSRSRMNSR